MHDPKRQAILLLPMLAGALILPAAAAPRRPARRAPQPRVRLLAKSLTPKTAKGGANITAGVRLATSGGATVSGVSLRLVGPGSVPSVRAMSAGAGGRWTVRVPAPANHGKRAVNVNAFADLQTSLGARSVKLGVVKVTPTPLDPNSPPPPPPI